MRSANVRGLSVRRLEVFKAVVEASRFSRAAAALQVTQPSVTAHMKALERQIGRPLFVRGPGRSKCLTEAGKMIYGYALEAVRRAEEVTAALDDLTAARPRRLVLGVQRSLAREPLIKCLAPFMKDYPECKLIVHSGTNDEVLGLLKANAVDAAIFFSVGAIDDLESEIIGSERIVFVTSPSHPLARSKQVTPQELAKYDFVTGLSEAHSTRLYQAVLRRMGIERHVITMEAQEPEVMIDLARYSSGIACSFQSRVEDYLKRGSLVALRIKMPPMSLDVRWATPPNQALPQIVLTLVRMLKARHVFNQSSEAVV